MLICQDCFEPCEVLRSTDSTDYAGTHCNGGLPGTVSWDITGSSCCEADYKDVDSDLCEWFQDIKALARKNDVDFMLMADPEEYKGEFDEGLSPREALLRIADVWDVVFE